MNPKTLRIVCFLIPLLHFSCERKKEKPVAESAPPAKPLSAQIPVSEVAPAQVKSGRGLPPLLEDAFVKLRTGAPKIPTILKAWDGLWSGSFVDPLGDNAASQSAKLSDGIRQIRSQVSGMILNHLQSGQTLNGFDRGTLAGVYGLYVGWLNEHEISGEIYILLRKRCNELPQTRGDAILSIINQDVIDVLEPPSELDEEAKAGWKEIALGKNPIYRQISLSLFPRMTSDTTLQAEFLSYYAGESEPTIKEQVLGQILLLPPRAKESALEQFKQAQEVNGDLIFNGKIQQAIDTSSKQIDD
jgi:hypothetical protein